MSTTGPSGAESRDAHQEWDEYAAGYALNALGADEATAFLAHLSGCEHCQSNLDDHNLVAAQLGAMAHPSDATEPPTWESVRHSILAGGPVDELAVRRSARSGRGGGSRRILAAAASVAVLAGGGVLAWQLNTPTRAPMTAAASLVSSCDTTSGCHVVRLDTSRGTTAADVADLVVTKDTVTVVPAKMPAAAAGKQYVLWQLSSNHGFIPVSEFTQTGEVTTGRAALAVAYTDTAAFAISTEAAGPIPATPTKVVAIGSATT